MTDIESLRKLFPHKAIKELTEEIKRDFVPRSVIDDIKAEIEAVTRFGIAYHPIEHGVLMDIIDRHTGKEKEDAETGP